MKEKEIISKVRIYDYEELSEADRELIDKAKEATQTSYAPFSKFCGAAARLSDGRIVTEATRKTPPSRQACARNARHSSMPTHATRRKRGRTGHCAYAHGASESSHPSLRSLPASHSRSGRTVRTSRTHPAVRRRGYYVVDSVKALLPCSLPEKP